MMHRSRLQKLEVAAAPRIQRQRQPQGESDEIVALVKAPGDPYATYGRLLALVRCLELCGLREGAGAGGETLVDVETRIQEHLPYGSWLIPWEQFLIDREIVDAEEMGELEDWRDEHGPASQPLRDDDLTWLSGVFPGAVASITVDHAWRPGRVTISDNGEVIGEGRTVETAYTEATRARHRRKYGYP